MSVGGHFVGECDSCRPSGAQEVGALNNSVPLQSSGNRAEGSFVDSVAKLAGVNSILGRSVIVHGEGSNGGVRIGQCVIGRASNTGAGSDLIVPAAAPNGVACSLRGTDVAQSVDVRDMLDASNVTFVGNADPGQETGVYITWNLQGLWPSGNNGAPAAAAAWPAAAQNVLAAEAFPNGMHVHTFGDVRDPAGATSTGGHFIGPCTAGNQCRPHWAAAQEVGMLLNMGKFNGSALGMGKNMGWDDVPRLSGASNIVARSVVVHRGSSGPRVGQCVIGLANPESTLPTNCTTTAWTAWACDCPDNAKQGTATRSRSIAAQPTNGGSACPALTDTSTCECAAGAAAGSNPLPDHDGMSTATAVIIAVICTLLGTVVLGLCVSMAVAKGEKNSANPSWVGEPGRRIAARLRRSNQGSAANQEGRRLTGVHDGEVELHGSEQHGATLEQTVAMERGQVVDVSTANPIGSE